MSILKSIMHHWNKTTNSYDTLHPETESAQITDWHSGIMASLASTTLGTVVSAVTTDSVLGKLIKLLLDASGVKYLIDTNGYVCFGSLFGGLIIQWGANTHGWVAFPVAFTSFRRIMTNHQGASFMQSKSVEIGSLTGYTLDVENNSSSSYDAQWITVGK